MHPFLALGEELLRRGHEVVVLTGSHFEKAVRCLGLEFASIVSAEEFLNFITNPDSWDRNKAGALVWKALVDATPRIVEAVRTYARPGTVLVANYSTIGAFIARELFRLPMVSIVLNPYLMRSMYSPPHYGIIRVPAWTGRVGAQVLFKLIDAKIRKEFLPPLNRVREPFGLAPIQNLTTYARDVERIACAWSRCLYSKQLDWPEHADTVGFLYYDQHETGEEITSAVKRVSKPPIVFTLGTGVGHARQFFTIAVQTAESLGSPAILVSHNRAQIPEHLPAAVQWIEHSPFERLLPNCAAIVHHGGIGTCARALQAGIPQVIVPLAFDQFDNAARCARIGVARIASYEKLSAKTLRACLEQLLQSRTVRENCQKCASRLPTERGVSRLADIAESFLNRLDR